MNIPLDEVVHFDAFVSNPSSGAAIDADSTPTFAVMEEDNDTAIVSGNLTKRTSLTGNYRGTFTASAANGFEVGKWYNVIATAVVGGVTGKARVLLFRLSAAEAVAGVAESRLVDGAHGGTAAVLTLERLIAASTTNGQPGILATGGASAPGIQATGGIGQPGIIGNITGDITGSLSGNVGGSVGGSVAQVTGDVSGKVLGGGAGTISGTGVRAVDGSGNAIASAASLATAAGNIVTILAAVDTEIGAIMAKTDLLTADVATWAARGLTMIELDGAVYRYTTNALEQSPAGGGGSTDWTAAEREQIRKALGITGTVAATTGTGNLDLVLSFVATLSGAVVTVASPLSDGGTLTLVPGDDYSALDGRQIDFVGESADVWPDLTGATVALNVADGQLCTGTVVTPTGTQRVRFQPTAIQTATLEELIGTQDYDVTAVLPVSLRRLTLVRGENKCIVTDSEAD